MDNIFRNGRCFAITFCAIPAASQTDFGLDRIVAMLTKLGQRGYAVHEESAEYGTSEIDPDTDPDADGTGRQRRRQQSGRGDGIPPPHR